MQRNDAMALIFARNAFYRRMHFLALGIFVLTIFVNICLVFILYFIYTNPTKPAFFATDDQAKLIHIIPVSQPNMSNDEVIAWTIKAVQDALSFNYVNYREQLQNSQKYFTNYGWNKYMDALTANNNLIAVYTRKLVGIATVVGQPKIVTQGLLSGAYAWKFEMPVLVTYLQPPYDQKSRFTNPLELSVIVQRQPVLQSNQGLGILQLVANIATAAGPKEISNVPTG